MEFKHTSVLLEECIEALDIKESGTYVDCTMGGAGHSKEIIKKLSKEGKLIGIDQDMDAIKTATERLKEYDNKIIVHDNFYNIDYILEKIHVPKVDGILMDLGVSSYQLDTAERGFSYMREAKLDMRMDREAELSAYEVVNEYDEEELTRIFKEYGEERFARRIARRIGEKRSEKPIETTMELVNIIEAAIPNKTKVRGSHPAKRTFQAIRIEVNSELSILNKAIEDSVARLNKGGRLAIITFHSLEDRIVKHKFKELATGCTCPRDFPICVCGNEPKVKLVTRKPIEATEFELEHNTRSRSAKLRVIEKV
ncbi:16S rRNA (cytosine(1402)-N(4))-methyltransferase RsmH [Oceanirhabdus sp. W0125-5]|uniref:16S rRNA (cytosine(1402)-N(4))-methyltransferase RsmH n=1 Tax=Oceanirhabdus sp. W0125-5 TaxID=2999116 RepID=UPI0022F2ACAE|nr:16S rRNA (cytosine(1402)-N(4))-methyltransferase RsmH [Oceanirhabdus sp. W0125-5]WBW95357.1 16S rRNA (cytosine(1402)-N(4))-methyltransferase RsmH [Oceanirhabdus sp. W0125-5]